MSAPPYEVSTEVSEDDVRRHGMTFDQVADAVRRSSWTCRRCGQSGGNPAADDRAGLPQGGVRGPGPLDATRREPPPPRRRGDGRRRLRGGRPAAPLRRRDGDDGLRLPHRGTRERSSSRGLNGVRPGTRGRARPRACRSGSARTRRRYRAVSARTCCGTSFAGFVLVFPVLTLFSVELRPAFRGASASRPRSSARSR